MIWTLNQSLKHVGSDLTTLVRLLFRHFWDRLDQVWVIALFDSPLSLPADVLVITGPVSLSDFQRGQEKDCLVSNICESCVSTFLLLAD